MNLGLSGRLTRATIGSPLTPLFLLASLIVGLIAVIVIPREEEPQISVPMVDIRVNADGLRGPDAVELVTKPLEAIVKGIDGVEHVYSQTEDDRVMVTARFLVGTKSEDAILRVHEKIRANLDRIPVGIPEPLIVGRGINDVAVSVLTLSPKPEAAERWTDKDLYELADKLRAELMKVDSIGLTYISGGGVQQMRAEPDPRKLSLFGVTADEVEVTGGRDYGETANEKANELLFHLGLATISIVVLIAIAIGWREALVTLVVIPTTILLTLFAADLMGYTINRVSLFALIFSIGILVDDAIVVVENIARHWAMRDGRPRLQATIEAVAEVGNPTVVATLTVVAALLPMLFVSGLIGPYMSPVPTNPSAATLFSFFVAMVVAPWLILRLAPKY